MIIQPMPYPVAAVAGSPPSFFAVASGVDNNDLAVSIDVPYPASLQADDIAFIHVASIDAVLDAHSVNTPAGWNQASHVTIQRTDSIIWYVRHALFWRRLVGDESGTVTISRTGTYGVIDTLFGVMSLFRGCVASGTPYEDLTANSQDTNSGAMVGAAIDTTGADRLALHFGMTVDDLTATPDTGWTEVYDITSVSGAEEAGLKLFSKEIPAAGSVASASHTLSATAQGWVTAALALIPA